VMRVKEWGRCVMLDAIRVLVWRLRKGAGLPTGWTRRHHGSRPLDASIAQQSCRAGRLVERAPYISTPIKNLIMGNDGTSEPARPAR
jgi:hypothetical protein